ncbi:MAG: cytochrome b5-like heme/steroid binding domain-containing protein [Candidatus Paceibacterota bacterium]|jgi:cytochrome b involved in lipid metabolism
MKKIIWIFIIIVLIVLGVLFFNKSVSRNSYKYLDNGQVASNVQSQASTTITLSDISSHNSKDSCWSTIEGKVYDLTSFISKHPGGADAILAICGKDGSELFDGQHGMDPRAKGLLPNFYLGDLVK